MGIGGIIAGALQGAGEAGVAVGKQWMAEDAMTRLRQMEAEIAQARDARQNDLARELQGNQITATKENIGTEITSREGIVGKEIASREGMQEKQIGSTKTLQKAQQTWQGEQNDMQRDLTREQIAAQKAIAGANNATALKVAQIGGTIGQDKDGNVLFYGKDGTAKPIMDPNNPNTPLKGHKDLTPAAKAYVDVIKDQLEKLMTQETAVSAAGGDPAALAQINQQRAKLNVDLLNVITGGVGAAGKVNKEYPKPTAQDQSDFEKRKGDPKFVAAYQERFGLTQTAPPPEVKPEAKRVTGGSISDAASEIPASKWATENAQRMAERQAQDNASKAKKLDAEIAMARKEINTLPLKGPADVARRARLAKLEADRSKIKD